MSLKKTAIWLTILAVVVKLSGFVRESIIAHQFGVSQYTDGYLLAFSFITLALAMISGGFNNVFLPMYVQQMKEQPKQAERNANGVMNWTVLIFLAITVTGYFFVPDFVPWIYGDMKPQTKETAIAVTQFFFLFMSFIALSGILDSYLQGRRVFVPSQIAKLLQTVMGVAFAFLFSEQWGINSLAYGFIFGTILGTILQLAYLFRTGYRWSPVWKVEREFRKTFLVLLVPSLLNSVVGQINVFVNKAFASDIKGAVTYLNDASLITSIPQTVYATSIAVIIFTLLSEQLDNQKKFQDTFFLGMQLSLLTLMPITAWLMVAGRETIAFIFERGKFTAADTYHTYLALVYYLPTIVTQGLQYIVSKSMYARGKTAIVFRISVTTIALNAILNWLFIKPFGYPGLALTNSLVSIYYLAATAAFMYKDFEHSEKQRLFALFGKVLLPTLFMLVPLYLFKAYVPIEHFYSLWQLLILAVIGAVLYAAGLYVFYREGFDQLMGVVKRKMRS
jgi:putative peptidoglycan lipid II flippase